MVPGVADGPGAKMPSLATSMDPTVPVPASVPPLLTVVRTESAIEPFTMSVPASTVVAPVYVLMPDRVSVPLPVLTSEPPVPPFTPPSWITPATSVERLLPPTVSCFDSEEIGSGPLDRARRQPGGGEARDVDGSAAVGDEADHATRGALCELERAAAVGRDGGMAGAARVGETDGAVVDDGGVVGGARIRGS